MFFGFKSSSFPGWQRSPAATGAPHAGPATHSRTEKAALPARPPRPAPKPKAHL